jgi:DNA-binding response OmpR family regulator
MDPETAAILIVETDQATRELYRRELEPAYKVFTCSNEEDVARLLEQETIHAVILEPAGFGDSGWRIVESLTKSCSVPLILCSSLDERGRGLALGVAAYLVKPVLPSELASILYRVIFPGNSSVTSPDANFRD